MRNLEKGMVFERQGRMHLVLERATENYTGEDMIVAKDLSDGHVWCIDEDYLIDIKIWGDLND